MIRSMTIGTNALTIRNLNAFDCLKINGTQIQSVRWKRKPIWLPTAKSKIFRIPQKEHLPEDELIEIRRLYNNYRTTHSSILKYFRARHAETRKTLDVKAVEENVKNDFELCTFINDQWNKQVAAEREMRVAAERLARKEEIAMKLEAKEKRDLSIQEKVDAEIRKAKEDATTFITPRNIDEAIEKALETIVDHNTAIDLNGNFYRDEPGISALSNTTKQTKSVTQ